MLRLAASLDQGGEHPLAGAIVDQTRAAGLRLSPPETFESASGIGVSGQVEGRHLKLGNTALMQEAGVTTESLQTQAEKLRGDGTSIMYLAINGSPWQVCWLYSSNPACRCLTPDLYAVSA